MGEHVNKIIYNNVTKCFAFKMKSAIKGMGQQLGLNFQRSETNPSSNFEI